ncbi:MAG TPA: 16S rRNA (guanine(966)-N(2))-methyltransferase RsmD [Vicinamibacterales bacterium]|nr:16S rRNA (guanine(966)-N(2))-methyltransferase RsmD [Vicinamibacterales bacterium]
MRIVAGTLKGRRIDAPTWDGLRPTSDKLRETLFNVLAPRIEGARVLDGFAGTGAVGIEALSRGAAHVTFVERDPRAIALIQSNLERCGITDRYAIIRARFAGTARPPDGGSFDIIFLDPPYGARELTEALEAAAPLVQPQTLLVIEHARRDSAPDSAGMLDRLRVLTSGDSALAFYRLRSET